MTLDQVLAQFLNGEPIHDTLAIGIIFTVFIIFSQTFFSAVFSLFKRGR